MPATTARLALVALACAVAAPASAQLLQRKDLSYPIALTIAQAALDDCKARGYATSVVVVDRGGNTVVALRADNASAHRLAQVLEIAERSSVIIYTVGLFAPDDQDANPKVLYRLAQATGQAPTLATAQQLPCAARPRTTRAAIDLRCR